jgi:4-hydroxybenzoate polyprenyltransferase
VDILRLTRPQNAISPMLVCVIGSMLGLHAVDHRLLIYCVITIFLMLAFATVQNDIEDFEIDRTNHRKSALTADKLSIQSARLFELLLLLLALILAGTSPNPKYFLSFVVIFFFLATAYNKRPFYFSRKPVMSIIALGLSYGTVPVLFGLYLGTSRGAGFGLLLGLSWFLIKASSIILKDYKDVDGDRKHAKLTFVIRNGKKTTQIVSVTMAIIGYGLFLYISSFLLPHSWFNIFALVLLVLVVVTNIIYRTKYYSSLSNDVTGKIFSKIITLSVIFELGVIAWLLIS